MRQRLRDREAALCRRQGVAEELQRDLVARLRLGAQRRLSRGQPRAVVFDQLARAGGWIGNRLAVARVDDVRGELDRPFERGQVIAERIGPALRIEADRRRDAAEQVVAADQDAVAEKAEMAVRVARQLEDLPSRDYAPLVDQVRAFGEADERRKRVPFGDQLVRDLDRDTVEAEPGCDPRP